MSRFEEGVKVGALKVLTDVAGEINAAVVVEFVKPRLYIETWPRFINCFVNELCFSYIKVFNHLPVPIDIQLLVLPKGLEIGKYAEMAEERFNATKSLCENSAEFENCESKMNEEILTVKNANKQHPQFIKNQESEVGIFQALKQSLFLDKTQLNTQNSLKNTQSYFVSNINTIRIPSKTSKILGPIMFQPLSNLDENLSLILRNNYTIIEPINIKAYVGYSKLSFTKQNNYMFNGKDYTNPKGFIRKELSKLVFEATKDELNSFLISKTALLTPKIVRGFELQNQGNIDVTIKSIMLEGNQCEFENFALKDCFKSFILKPQEFLNIQIVFTPFISFNSKTVKLFVFANDEILSFNLEAEVSDDTNFDVFFYENGEIVLLIGIGFTIALIILVFQITCETPVYFRSISTKDTQSICLGKIFTKKYSPPVHFSNKDFFVPLKSEISKIEQACHPLPGKKRVKVRRTLINAKIEKADDLKANKNLVRFPEIFANNKLLVGKKNKKKTSDDPAPHPKEIVPSKADEDFFIDSYKTNNVFFGRISNKNSFCQNSSNHELLDNLLD